MTIRKKDMPDFSFDESSAVMTVASPREFSFAETIRYLARSSAQCLHQVEKCTVYKLLEINGEHVVVEIGEGDGSAIRIGFTDGVSRSQAVCEAVRNYVRDWFDLRTDLTPFYRMAEGDPLLGRLTSDYFGLRIIGIPDLFEALCWAVIGQQVNLAFAYTLKKRFIESYGKHVEWNGRRLWLFPKPQVIAFVAADELKKLQFTARKAEYIITIAQLMESGALSKQALMASGDYQAAERELTAIRGIGPWTAHYVLMRCLRDPSAFPVGDAGLQNALKQLLHRPHKPAEEEIRRIFSPWRSWEAYAVFYLWRSVEDG